MIKENQKTLRELRSRYNLTQAQVAEKVGMQPAYYNVIENVNNDTVAKFAELYGVDPATIYIVG